MNWFSGYLLFCQISWAFTSCPHFYPYPRYELFPVDNHTCYYVSHHQYTYYNARTYCEGFGNKQQTTIFTNIMSRKPGLCDRSLLASIRNENEGDFFLKKLREVIPASTRFWIANKLEYSPELLDPNCEDREQHWKNVYREECLSYSADGTVQKEADCLLKLPFICTTPENYYLCSYGERKKARKNFFWSYSLQTKSCYTVQNPSYIFSLSNPTYEDLLNFCGKFDAQLVSIHSEIEDKTVYEIFDSHAYNNIEDWPNHFDDSFDDFKAMIGLKYDEQQSNWTWYDGTDFDYMPNQTNLVKNGNVCGMSLVPDSFRDGWKPLSCSEALKYMVVICKKPVAKVYKLDEYDQYLLDLELEENPQKPIKTTDSTKPTTFTHEIISLNDSFNTTILPQVSAVDPGVGDLKVNSSTSFPGSTINDSTTVSTSLNTETKSTASSHWSTSHMESTITNPHEVGNENPLVFLVSIFISFIILVIIAIITVILIKRKYRLKITRMGFYKALLAPKPSNKIFSIEPRLLNFGEIPEEDLIIDRKSVVGTGGFAIVYKGHLKSSNPELRRFSMSQMNRIARNSHIMPQKVAVKVGRINKKEILCHELEIMKNLGYHVHLLYLIGYRTLSDIPMLVLEYCVNKDLLTYLRKNQTSLMETTKLLTSFAWQICDGMVYLSSNGFIHRDLAARNIFITDELVAKIGDFGLCQKIDTPIRIDLAEKLPIKWWSYGVLMYEIFSLGRVPYETIENDALPSYLYEGKRLERPESCPENIYNLMASCWFMRPDERPSFDQLRNELGKILEAESSYGYIELTNNYGIIYQKTQ